MNYTYVNYYCDDYSRPSICLSRYPLPFLTFPSDSSMLIPTWEAFEAAS